MVEERKEPKIRLIAAGEGLEKIISEIKNHSAAWGHKVFISSSVEASHHDAVITVLRKGKGEVVINATIGEQKIQGSPLDLETFIIRVISALTDKLVELYINKNKRRKGNET